MFKSSFFGLSYTFLEKLLLKRMLTFESIAWPRVCRESEGHLAYQDQKDLRASLGPKDHQESKVRSNSDFW